jgi:hypothetical protein
MEILFFSLLIISFFANKRVELVKWVILGAKFFLKMMALNHTETFELGFIEEVFFRIFFAALTCIARARNILRYKKISDSNEREQVAKLCGH